MSIDDKHCANVYKTQKGKAFYERTVLIKVSREKKFPVTVKRFPFFLFFFFCWIQV